MLNGFLFVFRQYPNHNDIKCLFMPANEFLVESVLVESRVT